MRIVFADACYWIALLNPQDSLNQQAHQASRDLGACRIVTSEMVLVELLNGLSGSGELLREKAAETVMRLRNDPNVEVVPQTSLLFQSATARYASRLDKDWGATDCASFILMEERRVFEALTNDHHFRQAGFIALMEESS